MEEGMGCVCELIGKIICSREKLYANNVVV